MSLALVTESFQTLFGASAEVVVRAPGRVNLIGEHTDYNEGYVLPMALEHSLWIALRRRQDDEVYLHSLDFGQAVHFSLTHLEKEGGWGEYVKGVAWALLSEGEKLRGWEGVLRSEVPVGAGLSSSAALEIALARAFAWAADLPWDGVRMALLAQKAENQWVGVQCGIMDQMASALSQANHALFLDCRTLERRHIPVPSQALIVVMDTTTRRGLLTSAYNERRAQCEEAARRLGVRALRDLSPADFARALTQVTLDEVILRRARHVISENARVLEALQALQRADLQRLGELFNASHLSLRDDFQVTNAALNHLVESAWEHPACYGARMTGAGFGGCALALVASEAVPDFVEKVGQTYHRRSGLSARFYPSRPAQGVEIFTP